MAISEVAAGTNWIEPRLFGDLQERWRLDDYRVRMEVKQRGDSTVLIEATTENGRLIIVDAAARRLEINVGWELIEEISPPTLPASFEFDFLFINKTTTETMRSSIHELRIVRGITERGA